MSRYFLDVQIGELFRDEDGTSLPDRRAAHNLALEVLANLVRDAAEELWRGEPLRVIVHDEERVPLFTVDATTRPAGPAHRGQAEVREFSSQL